LNYSDGFTITVNDGTQYIPATATNIDGENYIALQIPDAYDQQQL